MKVRRAPAAAALALAAALGMGPAAAAQDERPVVGVIVQHDDGSALQAVRIADLHPTATQEAVLFVDDGAPQDVRRMRIEVENLEDRENGCLAPEGRAGDASCEGGDDRGELSQYLQIALTAGREEGSDRCAPIPATRVSTTLPDLVTDAVTVGLPDEAGRLCVLIAVTHDEHIGNDVTQTDGSRFDFRLQFDARSVAPGGTAGNVEGNGASAVSPEVFQDGDQLDLALTSTGVPLSTLLGGMAIVLGLSTLVVLVARRRADRHLVGVPS